MDTPDNIKFCYICGVQAKPKFLFNTKDYLYGIKGRWDLVQCEACSVMRIDPILSVQELTDLYPRNYYAYSGKSEKLKNLFKHIFTPTLIVKEVKFPKPGRVLDYGCGNGKHLSQLKKKGWSCIGIEPSETAVQFGIDVYGIDILCGTSASLKQIPDTSIDYIRANHSLEHDPEIQNTLAEFSRILRQDGKVLVGIPNAGGMNFKIFNKYWWYLCAPVHVFHFNPSNFADLAGKHSFQIEELRYKGNFTGLLLSLIIYINRHKSKIDINRNFYLKNIPLIIVFQLLSVFQNIFRSGDAIEIVLSKKQRTA